jgi:uncharacterized protein (TIRG00374 family)
MRLAINLLLSCGMLALCLWLVWPDAAQRVQLADAFGRLEWRACAPYLAAFLGLQLVVHLCRALRWSSLLAPLGVRVPPGPLLAISSVGFMAILALPARLGELVRPGLLRRHGASAAAALGTVAVERIVDGLLTSLLVAGAFFAIRGPRAPAWMMPTAYLALGGFAAALVLLVLALWRPEAVVRRCLAVSLLPRLAPRAARALEARLLDVIRGFAALAAPRHLAVFCAWSLVYWAANGLALWVQARAFGLPLSVTGGLATMGLVSVGISLPNSPGLVGQYQWFTLLGLSLYLGPDVLCEPDAACGALHAQALAFAIACHLLQVVWYLATGALGLASPWVSLADLRGARRAAAAAAAPPPD